MAWELGRQPCHAPNSALLEMPAGSSHLTGMKSAFIYAVWSGSWARVSLFKGLIKETVECYLGIHCKFGKSSPNELSLHAGSAEQFRSRASNVLQLFPVLGSRRWLKGAAVWWSLKCHSTSRGQLPRAVHAGHRLALYFKSQGISQGFS